MGILTVSSTNPDLSYILQKNPATILAEKKPFRRSLRKGNLFGWFTNKDATEWRMFFKDSDIDTSFGNQDFEYLDRSRYSSPQLPISIISEALRSASINRDEKDVDGFMATCKFSMEVKYRVMTRLISSLGDTCMEVENPTDNEDGPWDVTIKAPTVHEVLNITQIVCVLACLADDDIYIPMKEDGVRKYLRTLLAAKMPYYVWHLFVSRAITSRGLFDKVKDQLDQSGFVLNYGNTQIHRHDAILAALEPSKASNLVDVGCGEMFHSLKLVSKHYDYVLAVEADADLAAQNQNKIERRQLGEVLTCQHAEVDSKWVADNGGLIDGADVLLSEVLEHRPLQASLELVKALHVSDANYIVVTLPCLEFGKYYGLDEGEMRHPDHKWEATLSSCLFHFGLPILPHNRSVEIKYIGDMVNDIGASICIVYGPKGTRGILYPFKEEEAA